MLKWVASLKTPNRAQKARNAVGMFLLAFALIVLPITTAQDLNQGVKIPASNPVPESPEQQVVSGVEAAVDTATAGGSGSISQAPLAQASPLPTPSLSNTGPQIPSSLPTGETNGDVDNGDGGAGGSNIDTRSTASPTPTNSKVTSVSKAPSL